MKDFFHHLLSADQSVVNSMTVLVLIITAPVMALCFLVVVNEVWILHKGLTTQVGTLLNVMMGAATGSIIGHGVSMFSQSSSYSQFSGLGMGGGELPYVPPGPPPQKAPPPP